MDITQVNGIVLLANSTILGFLLYDYLRFRFSPPYATREDCLLKHKSVEDNHKSLEGKIDQLRTEMTTRLDKIFDELFKRS